MKNNRIANIAGTTLVLGSLLSLPAYAAQTAGAGNDANSAETKGAAASIEREVSDAWREGKLDTIYLFNRHLNNFTIDPEVRGHSVVLTGKVESEVDKELAEQLALGVDGITEVTNRLMVVPTEEARAESSESDRTFSGKVEDATLTAEVKTKLLSNGETDGLAINVDTVSRTVTLTGTVKTSAEKALAAEIASNVDGVETVNNKLQIQS